MPAGTEKSKKASESCKKGSRNQLVDSGNLFEWRFLNIYEQGVQD